MEDLKVDYGRILSMSTTRTTAINNCVEELKRVGIDNVTISDAIVERDARNGIGQWFIMKLFSAQNDLTGREYKLRCLRDEYGNPRKSGDKITVDMGFRVRDENGKKIPIHVMNAAKKRGTFEKQYKMVKTFEVDDNLCISVPFTIAIHLLTQWGVHYETGATLCRHLNESDDWKTVPRKGEPFFRHHWLYEEVPRWAEDEAKQKRGRKARKSKKTETEPEVIHEQGTAGIDGNG